MYGNIIYKNKYIYLIVSFGVFVLIIVIICVKLFWRVWLNIVIVIVILVLIFWLKGNLVILFEKICNL